MTLLVHKDSTYILNYCARSLARDNDDGRHNYGQDAAGDDRARIAEAWRFPIVDGYYDGVSLEDSQRFNIVTFVYVNRDERFDGGIALVGTFATLYEPIPLSRVDDSVFWAVTVAVPKGQSHRYKFLVDGRLLLDPINPQQVELPDGTQWSRFFTDYCTDRLCFERWEESLLERLTSHVLPFRTTEGQRFLNIYYNNLDKQSKFTQYARAYRLDQPVGVVNFIDKLLARQEAHRLIDYKICLELIDRVLRLRDPYEEPSRMPAIAYADLYEQMAAGGSLAGWDYSRYSSPRFFLQLLRRHTHTGAFSHPKHGGNAGGVAWAYLANNLVDPATGALPSAAATPTCFDWRRGLEAPLGRNPEYRG
jgi:Gluconate 2-dehydrogenase subunit 3